MKTNVLFAETCASAGTALSSRGLQAFTFNLSARFAGLKIYALLLLFGGLLSFNASAQTVIHYNDFEQPMQGGGWTAGSSPTINASSNGIMRINNFSAGYNSLAKQLINGTSSFYNSLQYNTTLTNHANGTLVIWYFNFRNEVNAQPGGLCGTSTGCAQNRLGLGVILASTSTSAGSTSAGNRYAVVYGDAGDASATNGKLQLVRVADLANWNTRTVICQTAGTLSSALSGTQNGYYSCKVVYNPETDAWSLFARYDGATAFRDPLDPTAAYTQIGATTVDNTYTGAAHSGIGFAAHFTASNTFVAFDNYYVFNGIGNGAAAGTQISVVGQRNQSSPTVPVLSGITGGPNTSNGEQFYYVFGNTLGSNLTVTPPAGLEVGTSPTGTFSSSLVLTATNSQVGAKIYVRPTGTTAVSNTISHTATGATSKTMTVDQAAAGPIQATGVTINANDASQPLTVTFQNAGTTITGRWNPFQDQRAVPPTANMANSTTTCGFAAATTTKSYQAQSFRVSATGSYTFTMRTNGLFDGAGYIVTGAFVPGSCATGTWVSGSDNTAGAEPVITATLTVGVTYTLISQFSANQFYASHVAGAADRSYAWDVTPPAGEQILIPHVTCGNLIAGYWNGNHSAAAATQVQDYGVRNTLMNNSTTCAFTASTNRNYSYNDFQVTADGLYTFTMKGNTGYDGQGYIVRHSTGAGAPPYTRSPFLFSNCAGGGAFIQGDDANGEATITNVQLYAGVTYTLVSSAKGPELANNATVTGAFSWSVTGAGNLLTKVDGMLQWYTAASGGSPIGYGGSFDPVGAAGSGLANTAAPGTYTFYVAFGGYPNNRTAVDFVINGVSCVDPTIPTLSATETSGTTNNDGIICNGASVTLSLTGTLNDATDWQWYTGSCGGTLVGNGTSINVSPGVSATYYVRGEGGCVTPGNCGNFIVEVNALPNVTANNNSPVNLTQTINLSSGPNGASTYAWSGPSAYSVTNNQNPSRSNAQLTHAGSYTVTVTDANGCSNTASTVVTVNSCTPGTWTAGSNTTDWFTPGNWSCSVQPDSTTDVTIPTSPSGGNYFPVVNGIQTASVRDISIAASATITFSGAATLEVNGDFTNNGTANFETGELQMKGTNKTLNGNFTLGVLNIRGNTAINASGQVNVLDKLELQGGELNTNNKLTLKSSAAKTAFVDDFSSGFNGTVISNLTIERYVPGNGNKFHYFGALTSGTASKWNDDYTITSNAADNTPVTLDPLKPCGPTALAVGSAYGNLLTYDETLVTNCFLKGWRVRNTSAATDRGRGFAGRVPSTTVLTEAGTYDKTNVTLSGLSVTGTNTDATSKGFHFVSNPFWAPILWSGVTGSNLYGTAYRYDPNTGSYGAYNNITAPMEISTNEAFFVRGNWANVNSGNSTFDITFPASARTTGENNTFLRSGLPYAYGVKITVNAHNTTDHTLIAFDNRFTTAHDNGYDALKLDNDFNVANIYTIDATAQRSAILALPENTATASVPLNIDIRYTDVHELTFDLQSFPATAMVFLEDKTTGVWHNLRINNSYSFNATAGDNSARFVLHFTPAAVFNATASGCENNTGIISIQQDGGITWDYEIKDEQNTTVLSGSNLTGYMEFVQLAAGNYTIALVHESGYTATENITVIATENIALIVNATANTIFVNEPVTINAILSSNGTTNWDMGDGNVYNNTEIVTHSYTVAGNYTVSATAANDNCNDTKTIDITVEENLVTGIAANNDKTLKVYASGSTVFVEQYVSKELVNADLTLYNTLGQIIQQEKISELNYGAKQQINVNASSGIYYLHVVLSNGKEVQTKLLINR